VLGRWADAVLGSADLVEDLPRLDGLFSFPIDVAEWQPVPVEEGDVVRVLHAPNHPAYKGTRHVEAAVERLRAEGEPVELALVQGLPLDDARRLYERAHVVVDQLLIGAYAQFAIECMALGRPVVCYLNPRFAAQHPEWAEAPIVSATPDTILDELRRLVRDRALREELGGRGPDYVRRHHSLEAVGEQLASIYASLWRTP
jgi:glycosyltransferase involved in cell wall biosynthesis